MEKRIVKSENIAPFKCKIDEIPLTRKELRNLLNYKIPCLCCGREMLHPEIYNRLLQIKELSGPASLVIPILEPFSKIMFPVEKQVFNMLKELAAKYPDKNFQELLMMKKASHELALVRIQSNIFNKINFYRRILPKKAARRLRNLMITTNDIIFTPTPKKPFSRRVFITKIKNIVRNIDNKKIKEEIIEIAKRLPRSSDEVCAFVVKNARKRPQVIALNLIHPAVGTFEHLLPKSMNGMNNSLNFALECTHCNNSRHHYPIEIQIEENPLMPSNAQIHTDKLISLYKKEMLGSKEYIENLKSVLKTLSSNIIDLDLKKLYT